MDCEDEDLALAIALSQRETVHVAAPASIDETSRVHADDLESSRDEHFFLSRALQESAELAEQKRTEEKHARQIEVAAKEEEMQIQASISAAIQQHQTIQDAVLASDMEFSHALYTSHEESHARDSLEASTVDPHERKESDQGCWDCPHCTLRNAPYAPLCSACHTPPPPHVLAFAVMPPVQFGVEFELLVVDGHADGYSCQWLAKELTLLLLGEKVVYEGYTHATTNHWKIVTDASLSSNSQRDLCCEVVSPVLCGQPGLARMRCVLESLRNLGIDVNATCGFHVHVDAEPTSALSGMATLKGVRRLAQCFVALERGFDALVGAKRRQANRNEYCRSNRLLFGAMSNKNRWEQMGKCSGVADLVEAVSPDRYRKLNLTNLTHPSRPNTVEFRQHGGVDELLAAEAWVRLVVRFSERVVSTPLDKLTQLCRLHQNATEQDEVEALFQLLDCAGLRSFYTLDRRLFPTTTKSPFQGWRCDTCRRRFRDSRSLAQHADATGHHLHY